MAVYGAQQLRGFPGDRGKGVVGLETEQRRLGVEVDHYGHPGLPGPDSDGDKFRNCQANVVATPFIQAEDTRDRACEGPGSGQVDGIAADAKRQRPGQAVAASSDRKIARV